MAIGDFRVRDSAAHNALPTQVWPTQANTTVINAGEPAKMKTDGTGLYVIPCADGDGVIGTTSKIAGIAATNSTQTAAADGVISVYMPVPGVVYVGAPKTAGTCNTAAKILALTGKRVVLDLTSGVYGIDTAAADNAANAFVIVGGDPTADRCYFVIRTSGTIYN
jgi:hypothetical protein